MPKRETRSEVKGFWYVLVSTYQRKKGKLETHFFKKGQGKLDEGTSIFNAPFLVDSLLFL